MTDAQTEARAIARRLEALAEHLTLQPLTHADDVDIATIREAATALAAKDEKMEGWKKTATEYASELHSLRSQLAEARKALDALDRMSRGLDWCDQDEQARRWSAARRALTGGRDD